MSDNVLPAGTPPVSGRPPGHRRYQQGYGGGTWPQSCAPSFQTIRHALQAVLSPQNYRALSPRWRVMNPIPGSADGGTPMRGGWRPAVISLWSFSKSTRNCGSARQFEAAPLRAASDEQFGANSRRPSPASLNATRKLKKPVCPDQFTELDMHNLKSNFQRNYGIILWKVGDVEQKESR